MQIESVIYTCKIISNSEFATSCVAFLDNGDEFPSVETVHDGTPKRWIEQCEAGMGAEDELEIIDLR